MKNLTYKIIVFLLLFKLLDGLLYSFFSWALYPDFSLSGDYGSLNKLYYGLIDADIIFLGSSRTYLHINPEIIEKTTGKTAWNLGMDGSNFDQQRFTLEEYLLHNETPQIVVFEADLMSLDPDLLRFKTDLFLPYRNYSKHTMDLSSKDWEETLGYWLSSSTIYKQQIPDIMSRRKEILERFKNRGFLYKEPAIQQKIMISDSNDYVFINGAELKKGQILSQLPDALPISTPIRNFDFSESEERKHEFEKLCQFAEEKGVILLLLAPPYLNGEVDEGQEKMAVSFFSSLSQRYENTYFLDYTTNALFSDNLDLWWNTGHLNITGANLLSEQVGLSINQIVVLKK